MEERRFDPGEEIIKEGAAGDYFYVTASGELEVQQQCNPRIRPFCTLSPFRSSELFLYRD